MTLEEYYAKKYILKFKDFLPGGYDRYCDRNNIMNAERIDTFSGIENPHILKVQTRARFLRDGISPLWFIATVPIIVGTIVLTSGAIMYTAEKVKSLLDKLF